MFQKPMAAKVLLNVPVFVWPHKTRHLRELLDEFLAQLELLNGVFLTAVDKTSQVFLKLHPQGELLIPSQLWVV